MQHLPNFLCDTYDMTSTLILLTYRSSLGAIFGQFSILAIFWLNTIRAILMLEPTIWVSRTHLFWVPAKKICTTFVVLWDLSLVTWIFKKVVKKWGRFTSTLSRRITSVRTFQTDTQIVGSPPELTGLLQAPMSSWVPHLKRNVVLKSWMDGWMLQLEDVQ